MQTVFKYKYNCISALKELVGTLSEHRTKWLVTMMINMIIIIIIIIIIIMMMMMMMTMMMMMLLYSYIATSYDKCS